MQGVWRGDFRSIGTGLCRRLDMDFYEKALFVKPTWRLVSVAEAQLLMPFALCFYPHFR